MMLLELMTTARKKPTRSTTNLECECSSHEAGEPVRHFSSVPRSWWRPGSGNTTGCTVLFLLLATIPALTSAHDPLLSRTLHCERYGLARSQEVCRAFEREMVWTWTGHAVISPGYRVTWASVRRVFCSLRIESSDTPALMQLVLWKRKGEVNDPRLEDGATDLLKLLGTRALRALPELDSSNPDDARIRMRYLRQDIELALSNSNSIFNPSHPEFILRGGCPAE